MTESDAKIVTTTYTPAGGNAEVKLTSLPALSAKITSTAHTPKRKIAKRKTPVPKVWRGLVRELAQKTKNDFQKLTDPEEQIRQYGKAEQSTKSSVTKAFEWAAKTYVQKNGEPFTAKSLANSLYQYENRPPKSQS